jgi:hypothetical protein
MFFLCTSPSSMFCCFYIVNSCCWFFTASGLIYHGLYEFNYMWYYITNVVNFFSLRHMIIICLAVNYTFRCQLQFKLLKTEALVLSFWIWQGSFPWTLLAKTFVSWFLIDWLIDWLFDYFFFFGPIENISLILRCHLITQWRAAILTNT